jgi:hypothetical protein
MQKPNSDTFSGDDKQTGRKHFVVGKSQSSQGFGVLDESAEASEFTTNRGVHVHVILFGDSKTASFRRVKGNFSGLAIAQD